MAILDTLKQNKTDQVKSLDSLKSNLFTAPKAKTPIDITKFEGYKAPSTVSNNLIASNIGKNPIPADKLNTPTVNPKQVQTAVNTGLASGQSGFNASASKVMQEPVVIAEKPKSTRDTIQEGLIGMLGKNNSAEKAQIRKEAQVEEKARTSNRVLNELRSLRANFEDKKDKLETTNKEGRSMGAINNEINLLTKETNKNLAFKSIEYDIANNDYVSAQQTVDNRIKDITDEDNRQVQLYKTLYDFVQNDMSESEKVASQQAFQEKQATTDFARQKEIAYLNSSLRKDEESYSYALKSASTAQEAEEASQAILPTLRDKAGKITSVISDLENGKSGNVVGPNALARFSLTRGITGSGDNFIASVQQLASQETLDTLINLKKAGGTLGALNQEELKILENTASKINNWAIPDKETGKTIGYKVSQKDFKAELETMKMLTNRAITNAGGTLNSDPLDLGVSSDPLELGL